jgi:hypothetical protein
MQSISKLTSHYQYLRSNEMLHEARKVRFHKILRMLRKIRWTSEIFEFSNLRIYESMNLWIYESMNLWIFENKNKYYSWNQSKMIKNLDFEIEERVVILIIIFVLASGVIIPNAIIQNRMWNWIQNFQVFIVTNFIILLDDSMSVFIGIIYDSNDTLQCDKSRGPCPCPCLGPGPCLGPSPGPSPGSRFWCFDILMFIYLISWMWHNECDIMN